MELSKSKVEELYGKYEAARTKLKRVAEENEKKIDVVFRIVEGAGAAFAISWANGRYGKGGAPLSVMGLDADLVAGGVLSGAAIFELGGKHNDHLANLAVGCLSAYATREGLITGVQAQTKSLNAGVAPAGAFTGVSPAGAYTGVSPAGAYTGVAPAGAYTGVAPAGAYTG